MHFNGDRRDLKDIRKHLGALARLLLISSSELPNTMIGITHSDLVVPAARVLGADKYKIANERNIDSEVKASTICWANAARAVNGRPPLSDPSLYALILPTEKFIKDFSEVL